METTSKYFQSDKDKMNKRILTYLSELEPPIDIELPDKNVHWLYPLKNLETRQCTEKFYEKYYSDNNQRILILGINPGRFGAGLTGILYVVVFLSQINNLTILLGQSSIYKEIHTYL